MFVGNLPFRIDEPELKRLFSPYGEVCAVTSFTAVACVFSNLTWISWLFVLGCSFLVVRSWLFVVGVFFFGCYFDASVDLILVPTISGRSLESICERTEPLANLRDSVL